MNVACSQSAERRGKRESYKKEPRTNEEPSGLNAGAGSAGVSVPALFVLADALVVVAAALNPLEVLAVVVLECPLCAVIMSGCADSADSAGAAEAAAEKVPSPWCEKLCVASRANWNSRSRCSNRSFWRSEASSPSPPAPAASPRSDDFRPTSLRNFSDLLAAPAEPAAPAATARPAQVLFTPCIYIIKKISHFIHTFARLDHDGGDLAAG